MFLMLGIINFLTIICVVAIYDGIVLRRLMNERCTNSKQTINEYQEEEEEPIIPVDMSSYEIQRMHRERMLEERFEQLKAEVNKNSTEAEILADGIYNLPHDEILEGYANEEYAE